MNPHLYIDVTDMLWCGTSLALIDTYSNPLSLERQWRMFNFLGTGYSTPEYNAEQDAESYYVIAKNAYPDKITFVPFSQVDSLNVSKVRFFVAAT